LTAIYLLLALALVLFLLESSLLLHYGLLLLPFASLFLLVGQKTFLVSLVLLLSEQIGLASLISKMQRKTNYWRQILNPTHFCIYKFLDLFLQLIFKNEKIICTSRL